MQSARLIRGGIGLTPRLSDAVKARYLSRVDELWGRHGNIDRAMAGAAKSAEAYKRKLLNYRSRLIARTETIRSANAGQMQAWQQAADKGLLNRARTQRVWMTSRDESVCPRCEPMHGQTVAFEGEPFVSGLGASVDMPPEHVSCRCAIRLQFSGKA